MALGGPRPAPQPLDIDSSGILGWVERSETHLGRFSMPRMGFAALYPSYLPLAGRTLSDKRGIHVQRKIGMGHCINTHSKFYARRFVTRFHQLQRF